MYRALISVLSACAAALGALAGAQSSEVAAARPFLHSGETRPAVAVAADLASEGEKTYLVFTLSREVVVRVAAMERPDRVIVDLPEVNFHLPAEAGQKRTGVVSSFRYGLFAPGRSRVVIDLAQPALVSRVDMATDASGIAL